MKYILIHQWNQWCHYMLDQLLSQWRHTLEQVNDVKHTMHGSFSKYSDFWYPFEHKVPTWHGPDFTCNFPKTVLRPTETDQSQIYPKPLLCFDSLLLVNISRCSSQHLSVISSKHCLCLQLELRPTGTHVRLKNPDYLGLKTQTLPDHSLKNARWDSKNVQPLDVLACNRWFIGWITGKNFQRLQIFAFLPSFPWGNLKLMINRSNSQKQLTDH